MTLEFCLKTYCLKHIWYRICSSSSVSKLELPDWEIHNATIYPFSALTSKLSMWAVSFWNQFRFITFSNFGIFFCPSRKENESLRKCLRSINYLSFITCNSQRYNSIKYEMRSMLGCEPSHLRPSPITTTTSYINNGHE